MQYGNEVRFTGDGHLAIRFDTGTPLRWRLIDRDGRSLWVTDKQVRAEDGWHSAVVQRTSP